jgi:hypothetical protein
MNLKASTLYTFDVVRDYLWFNACPLRNFRKILPTSLTILAAAFLVMMIFLALTGRLVFLDIGILCLVFLPFLTNLVLLKPKKSYRMYHSQVDTPNVYHFYADYFQLHSDRTVDQVTDIYYSDLYRAYETDDYFFLYTMKRKACVVGKRNFTAGQPETLRSLLREKAGNKFHEIHTGTR